MANILMKEVRETNRGSDRKNRSQSYNLELDALLEDAKRQGGQVMTEQLTNALRAGSQEQDPEALEHILQLRRQFSIQRRVPLKNILQAVEREQSHHTKIIGQYEQFYQLVPKYILLQCADVRIPTLNGNIKHQIDTWLTELVSNGLDASNQTLIGKFGSGFMSALNLLYSGQASYIRLLTKKQDGSVVHICFTFTEGEIWVGTNKQTEEPAVKYIGNSGTVVQIETKNIQIPMLIEGLQQTFATCTSNDIFINGKKINKLNDHFYLKDTIQRTNNQLPVEIHTHQNNIFIRDYGIGMDEETILTKLIYPKAGTKQPHTYNKTDLREIIEQEANCIYSKGESKETSIQFQIGGVTIKRIQVPKQGNIKDFTLVLPAITYLPESRNEIKLTEEVFESISHILRFLTHQHSIQTMSNILGCIGHVIRSLDISQGPANNMAQELRRSIMNKIMPALHKQAKKEGKTIVQSNKRLQKCLDSKHIVYVDALFLPKLEIAHIPGVEPLENIVESRDNLMQPNRYCAEFKEGSEEEVIVLPQAILVNKKYIHTNFQYSIINNLANFSNSYELEHEKPRNGFIVSTQQKAILEKYTCLEEEIAHKNKKNYAQLIYGEIIDKIDENFDNLLSEGIRSVLKHEETYKRHMQAYILEPFDRNSFLGNAQANKAGMHKVLRYIATGGRFEVLREHKELENLFTQVCSKLRGAELNRFFLTFRSMSANVVGNTTLIIPEIKHLLTIIRNESENDTTLHNILGIFEQFDKPVFGGKDGILGRHMFQELIHYRTINPEEVRLFDAVDVSQTQAIPRSLNNDFGPMIESHEHFADTRRTYTERLIILLQHYISPKRSLLKNQLKIEKTLTSYFGIRYDLKEFALKNKELIQSVDLKSIKQKRGGGAFFYCFYDKFRNLNRKGKLMLYKHLLDPKKKKQELNKELEKMQYHVRLDTEYFNKSLGHKKGRRKKGENRYDRMINLREGKPIDIEDIAEAPWSFLQAYAQLEEKIREANEVRATKEDQKVGEYFEPLSLRDYRKQYFGPPIYDNTSDLLYEVLGHLNQTSRIERYAHYKVSLAADHFGLTIDQLELIARTNKNLITDIEKAKRHDALELGYARSIIQAMTEKGKVAFLDLVHSSRGLSANKVIKQTQDPSYWIEGKPIFVDYRTNKPARWVFKYDNYPRIGMLFKLEQLILKAKAENNNQKSKDAFGTNFSVYCSKRYPYELTNMLDLLLQQNQYLDEINSQATLPTKPTNSIRLSEISFLYNNYHGLLASSNSTKQFKRHMTLLKECNHSHYYQTIRSTIDGQDRGGMVFLRELVQNARDAIISSKCQSNDGIQVTFGRENIEGDRYRIARVQDPVGMDFNHIMQYLLPINVSSKSGSNSVGMYGQGFYSCTLGAKQVNIKTGCGNGITTYRKITPIRQESQNVLNNQIIDFTIERQEIKEEFKGTIVERVSQLGESSAETLGTIGSHFLHKYVGGIQDVAIRFNGKPLNAKTFSTVIETEKAAIAPKAKDTDRDQQKNKHEKQNISLVVRADHKSCITKDNLFVSDIDPALIAPFPSWIQKLIYEKGRSFDIPSDIVLNKTRNAIMDSTNIYPALQKALRPLLVHQILVLVCKESFRIPMLPEDYFYNTNYKYTESQNRQTEVYIQHFNQGERSHSWRQQLSQDDVALSQFLTGAQFNLDGLQVTLRQLRDDMAQGKHNTSVAGRISEQVKAHEARKDMMQQLLAKSKNKEFKHYKNLDSLSKALGVEKKKIIDFFTYCNKIATKIGIQAKRHRGSFGGHPGKACASKEDKSITWNTDHLDALRRVIEGFEIENSAQHQSLINTVVHECTHLIEGDEKWGTHESDKSEDQSFSALMIKLLTKLLRTTGVQTQTTQ